MVEVPRPVRKVFRLEEMSNDEVSRVANELKNRSIFAKTSDERDALAQDLLRVWTHTLKESSLRERQSSGRKGLESAHQHAVDGFITLIRTEVKNRETKEFDQAREKILSALKQKANQKDYERFSGYIKRIS